ncbi:hypothetical protein HPB49_009786 [Dermacentor silvarum]|uniref:Uncharacterized protein n=1 Tax=Dermacentor silvarum TaxID=543639 RepID=A0ACB8DYB1_DERSI|nr:hypothetical protein HPB49_009786 [Dermacentor silvarum]
MADLSGSLIDRFLDAVQQNPCVYDTKRLDYRDSGRKLNAWERIRLDSDLSTVEECHKLWKRLRYRYTRELKAIESAQRSGSGYLSRRAWEFAESMAFYRECGRPRNVEFPRSGGDFEETAESIFLGMQSTSSSPSATESSDTLLEELPSPATPTPVATPTLPTANMGSPNKPQSVELVQECDLESLMDTCFNVFASNTTDPVMRFLDKLGQSNAAAITFEGRKVPFNVFYWGEAVPVRLYRKTTPACTLCGTVGHRVDVCPNPRDDRCRACESVTPEEGHECQPRCLVCGDPHLTGSADCTWKYRRGAGAGPKPGGGKSSNKRKARGAQKDSGPGTQAQKQVAAPSPLPETRAATGASRQGPQGSSRPADNRKTGGAGLEPGQRKPRAAR